MTRINNKTTKVVGIAGEIVLPGATIEVSDEIANGSVVKKLVALGKLSAEKSRSKRADDDNAKSKVKAKKEAAEKTAAEGDAGTPQGQ